MDDYELQSVYHPYSEVQHRHPISAQPFPHGVSLGTTGVSNPTRSVASRLLEIGNYPSRYERRVELDRMKSKRRLENNDFGLLPHNSLSSGLQQTTHYDPYTYTVPGNDYVTTRIAPVSRYSVHPIRMIALAPLSARYIKMPDHTVDVMEVESDDVRYQLQKENRRIQSALWQSAATDRVVRQCKERNRIRTQQKRIANARTLAPIFSSTANSQLGPRQKVLISYHTGGGTSSAHESRPAREPRTERSAPTVNGAGENDAVDYNKWAAKRKKEREVVFDEPVQDSKEEQVVATKEEAKPEPEPEKEPEPVETQPEENPETQLSFSDKTEVPDKIEETFSFKVKPKNKKEKEEKVSKYKKPTRERPTKKETPVEEPKPEPEPIVEPEVKSEPEPEPVLEPEPEPIVEPEPKSELESKSEPEKEDTNEVQIEETVELKAEAQESDIVPENEEKPTEAAAEEVVTASVEAEDVVEPEPEPQVQTKEDEVVEERQTSDEAPEATEIVEDTATKNEDSTENEIEQSETFHFTSKSTKSHSHVEETSETEVTESKPAVRKLQSVISYQEGDACDPVEWEEDESNTQNEVIQEQVSRKIVLSASEEAIYLRYSAMEQKEGKVDEEDEGQTATETADEPSSVEEQTIKAHLEEERKDNVGSEDLGDISASTNENAEAGSAVTGDNAEETLSADGRPLSIDAESLVADDEQLLDEALEGTYSVHGQQISEPYIEQPDEETEKYDDNADKQQDYLFIEEEQVN